MNTPLTDQTSGGGHFTVNKVTQAGGTPFTVAAPGPRLVTPEVRVNSYTSGEQLYPEVAVLSGGGHVVIWQSPGDGAGLGVYGQRYDASAGKVGSEFRISDSTGQSQSYVDVAGRPDGGFFGTGPAGWALLLCRVDTVPCQSQAAGGQR